MHHCVYFANLYPFLFTILFIYLKLYMIIYQVHNKFADSFALCKFLYFIYIFFLYVVFMFYMYSVTISLICFLKKIYSYINYKQIDKRSNIFIVVQSK